MNEHSNPIEFLIDFAWANGADLFVVNNAKDELKRLRQKDQSDYFVAAWARLNSRGDIYDPSICHNEYLERNTVLPLYINTTEYRDKHGKLSE